MKIRFRQTWIIGFAAVVLLAANTMVSAQSTSTSKSSQPKVDFERQIAPLLGRLGCNSAACHGAFGGKGGMQFSLFGYSAEMDYKSLQSRVDTDDPADSLMLLKPTGEEEHEGGVVLKKGSPDYQSILAWISQGAYRKKDSGVVKKLTVQPAQVVFQKFTGDAKSKETKRLTVKAEFADGTELDVTHLSQFSSRDEGIAKVTPGGKVIPARNGDTSIIVSYRNGFAAVNALVPFPAINSGTTKLRSKNLIDKRIHQKLAKLNIQPSDRSNDAEFLRRLMLDTIGTIPTPEQVTNFCNDNSPDKREKKIDELLAHPMHAALWAIRMCDITKCDIDAMGETGKMRYRRAQMWHDWFRKRFENNTAYSELVRDILLATSRQDQSVRDWIKSEEKVIRKADETFESDYSERKTLDLYWRRNTDNGKFPIKEMAELTAVAFTGVRLNCAQCHKHPFDRWTQNDYAAFANIFSRVNYGSSTELNKGIFDEFDARREANRQGKKTQPLPRLREVFLSDLHRREVPGSEKDARVVPRAFESQEFDQKADMRKQFYEWLIKPNNPYFARNFVNRVWAVYLGSGFVNPVDDFSVANPPSHPQLLNELAAEFRKSGFDIRKLEKMILMSDTYQRTSTPNSSNIADERNFSRQRIRPLMAEVALDTINKALETKQGFGNGAPKNSLAIQIGSNKLAGASGRTLQILGRGQRESICDCDRRTENDLRQYTFLTNDKMIHEKIKTTPIRKLMKMGDKHLVTQLYLQFLCRKPTAKEQEIAISHLSTAKQRDKAFDDLVWALLNTREFLTNH